MPCISPGQNRISTARPARQTVLGQQRVFAVEHALKRPMKINAFGLAQPLGLVIPFGQFRAVEAAGVVEAHPVAAHASVSSCDF